MMFPGEIRRRLTIPMARPDAARAAKLAALQAHAMKVYAQGLHTYMIEEAPLSPRGAFVIEYEGAPLPDAKLDQLLDDVAGRVADLMDAPHPEALSLRWFADALETVQPTGIGSSAAWVFTLPVRSREPVREALKAFRAPGWRRAWQLFGRDKRFVDERGEASVGAEIRDSDFMMEFLLDLSIYAEPSDHALACRHAAAMVRVVAGAVEAAGAQR